MNIRFRKRGAESGQSLVEFALLVPLLLLLLCGVLDFGKIMYTYMNIHMTAQEAVRLGGLGRTDVAITEYAKDHIHAADSDALEVQISPVENQRDPGEYMTVTLRTPYQFITPLIDRLFSDPLHLQADSTIRVE